MNRISKSVKLIAAAICATALPLSVTHAATTTGNIIVTANVLASCTLTTNPLPFGLYDASSATPKTAQTTMGLICLGATSADISIGDGVNAVGSQRRMKNLLSNSFLSYDLFRPTATGAAANCDYSSPWTSLVGQVLQVVGLSASVTTINVCGRMPIGQASDTGAFSDTVVVTVTF